jgi:hypothetical protein
LIISPRQEQPPQGAATTTIPNIGIKSNKEEGYGDRQKAPSRYGFSIYLIGHMEANATTTATIEKEELKQDL